MCMCVCVCVLFPVCWTRCSVSQLCGVCVVPHVDLSSSQALPYNYPGVLRVVTANPCLRSRQCQVVDECWVAAGCLVGAIPMRTTQHVAACHSREDRCAASAFFPQSITTCGQMYGRAELPELSRRHHSVVSFYIFLLSCIPHCTSFAVFVSDDLRCAVGVDTLHCATIKRWLASSHAVSFAVRSPGLCSMLLIYCNP